VLPSSFVNLWWLLLLLGGTGAVWWRYYDNPFKAGGISIGFLLIFGVIGGALGYIPAWLYVSMGILILLITAYAGKEKLFQ